MDTDRTDPSYKRRQLRAQLSSGRLLRFPGAFSPLVARIIESVGFEGVYVSGAALSAELAMPDIGLTTLTEVGARGAQIAATTNLPVLIDADTGFGEALNVARAISVLEQAGVTGCHIEDQVNPKRCGHLDHKAVVPREEMIKRLRAAVAARRDENFIICARTDARSVEGLDEAIARAQTYVTAGADMIFPEALRDEREFEAFRSAIDVPLLANMTEFGKSQLLDTATLASLGFNVVIYPVTTLRLAMGAIENGLREIAELGTQAQLVTRMQTRARLYELLGYEEYTAFDAEVFNFDISQQGTP